MSTILVADDDNDILELLASILDTMSMTVVKAHNGQEALDLYGECAPDLVILDYMMPKLSGVEVLKKIKSVSGGSLVPVIMLTAKSDIQDKVEALEGGADDYVTKPFHFGELQARIKGMLRIRELNLSIHRKNLELEETHSKLLEAERKLTVLKMAGTAAHELGQPLSAIMLNCHLIEKLPKEDARFKGALEAIKKDSERMSDLLDKLKKVDTKYTASYHGAIEIYDLNHKD